MNTTLALVLSLFSLDAGAQAVRNSVDSFTAAEIKREESGLLMNKVSVGGATFQLVCVASGKDLACGGYDAKGQRDKSVTVAKQGSDTETPQWTLMAPEAPAASL